MMKRATLLIALLLFALSGCRGCQDESQPVGDDDITPTPLVSDDDTGTTPTPPNGEETPVTPTAGPWVTPTATPPGETPFPTGTPLAGDDDMATPTPIPTGDDDTAIVPTATPVGDDDTAVVVVTPTPASAVTPTPASAVTPTPASAVTPTLAPATPTLAPATPTPGTEPTIPPVTPTPEPGATPTVPPWTPYPDITPPADPVVTLEVSPPQATIDMSSTLTYVAKGYLASGAPADLSGLEWISTQPGVATIGADGVVTPVSPGTTEIRASLGYVASRPVTLEIFEDGRLIVTVVGAEHGEPVQGARVYLGVDGGPYVITDADGVAEITGDFSGRQTVTAYHPDYHWVTVADVLNRRVVLPARSQDNSLQGTITGTSDFSNLSNLRRGEVRIGLVTRSFIENPLTLDTSTLIGDYRQVNVCGANLDLPSNIAGQLPANCAGDESLEYWAVPGPTGTYDLYMLAGDIPLDTVLSWAFNPAIFTNLGQLMLDIDNLDTFAYDQIEGVSFVAPEETSGWVMTPDGVTDGELQVVVPGVPAGMIGNYPPAVIALLDKGGAGMLPVGVAGAQGGSTAVVNYPPEFGDQTLSAVILAAEQGVGAEGAYAAVMGTQAAPGDTIVTPEFMEFLFEDEVHYEPTWYTFYPIPDVTVYRSVFTWKFSQVVGEGADQQTVEKRVYWDVYQPPTTNVVDVPDIEKRPRGVYGAQGWTYKSVQWELFGYDNGDWTFDAFTFDPDVTLYDSGELLERVSRNLVYNLDNYP